MLAQGYSKDSSMKSVTDKKYRMHMGMVKARKQEKLTSMFRHWERLHWGEQTLLFTGKFAHQGSEGLWYTFDTPQAIFCSISQKNSTGVSDPKGTWCSTVIQSGSEQSLHLCKLSLLFSGTDLSRICSSLLITNDYIFHIETSNMPLVIVKLHIKL